MPIKQRLYTVDELWKIATQPQNADRRLELIYGVIHEKMSPSFLPSAIAMLIGRFILEYLEKHPIGYITGADGGYVFSKNTKLIPDVGYISKQRMPEFPDREVPVPPDLAIEVVSPTDVKKEVQGKVKLYLQHGTKIVWVVYPDTQTVEVYRPSETEEADMLSLTLDDWLEGGDVLPDFKLAINRIFPKEA